MNEPQAKQYCGLSEDSVWHYAELFGTPLFLIHQEQIQHQFHSLRQALPSQFAIHYSVKANPAPGVISQLLQLGAGLEIASAGEFNLAMQAGASAQQIIFAGPCKSRAELQLVVEQGIGQIHLESFEEIELISEIALAQQKVVSVAVRVNPLAQAAAGSMRMGGLPSPFGFDEEILESVLRRVEVAAGLNLIGIHQFAATQVLNADDLLRQWTHAIRLGHKFEEILNRPPTVIDVGGGLGIPLYAQDNPLDLHALAAGCKTLPSIPLNCQMVVEPGRFLLGPAGIYICKIAAVKRSREKLFLICDGGMHHHLAASGNLGQVIKRDYPVTVLERSNSGAEMQNAQICGPLCTPLDVLARSVQVQNPAVGDLVVVGQSGAYASTASPMHFLGHPAAAEVLLRTDSTTQILRTRGTSKNLVPCYSTES
ncbi:MAG: alanine racemase [Planctomycetes bacterium]|nr:alanine racemase [Planctomycetota bacterium]